MQNNLLFLLLTPHMFLVTERLQFLVDGVTIGSIQPDQGLDPSTAPFDQEVLCLSLCTHRRN